MNSTSVLEKCRVCEHLGPQESFEVKEMMFGTREAFDYFRCGNCGCLQIENIPQNLSAHYPADYYSLAEDAAQARAFRLPWLRSHLERARGRRAVSGRDTLLARLAAKVVDLPPEIHRVGRLVQACGVTRPKAVFLDVGCGSSSWWLNCLKAVGFDDLHGLDPHIPGDITSGRITIRKATLGEITGKFDLITFHHSLEHIPAQIETLERARSLLNADGRCLVRIPVVSSLVWEIYGTDWVELDAPRHLFLHSLRSIAIAGARAGLELVTTQWDSTEFEFYGSEQYRRGIALTAEDSYWKDPSRSGFSYREMAQFRDLAARANREQRGGRACFVFKIGARHDESSPRH